MKIFISHIKDDEILAIKMKEWLEDSFLGQIEIFVSSDPGDIVVGEQWFKDIESFLTDTQLVIVLVNKNSLNRRWINFEAGAGWIKKIPVIPICFNGVNRNTLPSPLSVFQAIDLNHSNFSEIFFDSIAKHLSFSKSPNINYGEMNKSLLKATGEFFEEDDLGYLDHIESMESGFQSIAEKFFAISTEMTMMQIEVEKFAELVISEKKNPSQGSTKHMQKQSRKLAKKIGSFTELVSRSNLNYRELVNRVEKNINFIFNYSAPHNIEEMNELIGAIDSIKNAYVAAGGTRDAMSGLSVTMQSVPKFERFLTRSLKNSSEELNILVNNLDSNIDVLKKAEIDGNRVIEKFND